MVPVTERKARPKKIEKAQVVRVEASEPAGSPDAQPLFQNPQIISLVLAIVSLVVYGHSLSNGFVDYDDRQYITQNAHVQSGLTGATVRWAFTTFEAGNWHPLTWISHAFDVQVFGLSPAGHHLHSMVLHSLNVVLLFLVLWRATGSRGRSVLVAALFAVHPLNVECVAWAAERKSLLCTLFFFLALGCYGWFVKRPSAARYALLVFVFACGLMSKPMIITLPFVLLLLDYWPLQRVNSYRGGGGTDQKSAFGLVVDKTPLFVLSVASGIMTVIAQSGAHAMMSLSTIPISLRLENAICSYALYLYEAVWPAGLALFYPETTPKLWLVVVSLLSLGAISFWVWGERGKRPYLMVGWLWYLGTLVPVIGLVQVGSQAMADRYAYIPLIGIFVMVVWRLAEWCESRQISLTWQVGAAIVVLLALSIVTRRQIGFWREPLSLWTRSLEVTQDNYVAEDNLCLALVAYGRNDEAISHFEKALAMGAADPTTDMGLEIAYREKDPQKAIEHGERALTLTKDPTQLKAIYDSLGAAYARQHDYQGASKSFRQALRLDPSDPTAMMALGGVLLRQAAQRMSYDLDQHPTADGFNQLGSILEQAGAYEDARKAYESALRINPKLASAQEGLERLAKQSSDGTSKNPAP